MCGDAECECGGEATVSPTVVNRPPVADPLSVSSTKNTPVPITLSGSDPDGRPADLLNRFGSRVDGKLSGTAPNVTYTPTAGYKGADSFTFKVSDGQLDSAAAVVSIMVKAPGKPPRCDFHGRRSGGQAWHFSKIHQLASRFSADRGAVDAIILSVNGKAYGVPRLRRGHEPAPRRWRRLEVDGQQPDHDVRHRFRQTIQGQSGVLEEQPVAVAIRAGGIRHKMPPARTLEPIGSRGQDRPPSEPPDHEQLDDSPRRSTGGTEPHTEQQRLRAERRLFRGRGAALIGLAVIIGIVLLQLIDDGTSGPIGDGGGVSAGGTTNTTTPTSSDSTGTTVPTTAAAPVKPPAEVAVLVLNGSGRPGAATAESNSLKGEG